MAYIAESVLWCQRIAATRTPAAIDRATLAGVAAGLQDIDRCCLVYAACRGWESVAGKAGCSADEMRARARTNYLATVNL